MKKILLLFVLLSFSLAGVSQTVYRSTGDHVYVRTGPGKNYGHVEFTGAYGSEGHAYLLKGALVKARGAAKNGFLPVKEYDLFSSFWGEGWVSTKYLVKAKRCPDCKGQGIFDAPCPECINDEFSAHSCACFGSGKYHCPTCQGYGWK